MKNEKNRRKDVFVTIIFTESTASDLNLSLPHLERLHPENSQICLITSSECNSFEKSNNEKDCPSTSKEPLSEEIKDNNLEISSDVGLFSKNNFSSSSIMYSKYFLLLLGLFKSVTIGRTNPGSQANN